MTGIHRTAPAGIPAAAHHDTSVLLTATRRSRRVVTATRLGRIAEQLSRRSGLGAGGVVGGRVLLALVPRAVRELTAGRSVMLVSGTNGKTTTTAFLTAALKASGPVDTNADGANTRPGLARALAAGSADRVVLETDEGWLPWMLRESAGATAVLLNLSRDQLHRHHEVAHVAHSWQQAMSTTDHVVASADDPGVVMAALAAGTQTWVATGNRWTQDALVCPKCGDECRRQGDQWSSRCGLRRPQPDWWLEGDELVNPTERVRLELGVPGTVNRSNAAVAVAAASWHGVATQVAIDAIREITAVGGRYSVVEGRQHRTRLILAKNPASWCEALELVAASSAPLVLAFNSEGVDGRDPSWLYDVPFDAIAGRQVVLTGRRSTDMLVRLTMCGLSNVTVAPNAAAAIAMLPAGEVNLVGNYTAFQDARRMLRNGS